MRILRWFGFLVLALVGLVVVLFVGARFSDGPLALIPGGPLRAGELVQDRNVDWKFAADIPEIELQLASQSTSRTVWIVVRDGQAYVPASLSFPPGKTWHKSALEDGRVIVRVDGKRYERTLVREDDLWVKGPVAELLAEKYQLGEGGPVSAGNVDGFWLFRLDPTSS